MDGHQFEHACASILRSKGFSGVKVTKAIINELTAQEIKEKGNHRRKRIWSVQNVEVVTY